MSISGIDVSGQKSCASVVREDYCVSHVFWKNFAKNLNIFFFGGRHLQFAANFCRSKKCIDKYIILPFRATFTNLATKCQSVLMKSVQLTRSFFFFVMVVAEAYAQHQQHDRHSLHKVKPENKKKKKRINKKYTQTLSPFSKLLSNSLFFF